MAARRWITLVVGPLHTIGSRRSFSTDGPFRHIRPNFIARKKHYNELLIFGDRRKLLETAQDLLSNPGQSFPRSFWEILAKRSIQSAHLLEPLELAILARAFDMHDVELRADLDIYATIASQVRTKGNFSGVAIAVLVDVLPRRLRCGDADVKEVLGFLGRRAADVMWELEPAQAVAALDALTRAGVQDAALCSRVARKVSVSLQADFAGALQLEDLERAAAAFAGQGHRDLELLRGLAAHAAALAPQAPAGSAAVDRIAESLAALGVEDGHESTRRTAAA